MTRRDEAEREAVTSSDDETGWRRSYTSEARNWRLKARESIEQLYAKKKTPTRDRSPERRLGHA